MKHNAYTSMIRRLFAMLTVMLFLAGSSLGFAQDRGQERDRDVRPVGNQSYTGVVEFMDEPNHIIGIDDQDLPFERERITVKYQGKEVDKHLVSPGITIRYTLDREGYLSEVFLLSPRSTIENRLIQ